MNNATNNPELHTEQKNQVDKLDTLQQDIEQDVQDLLTETQLIDGMESKYQEALQKITSLEAQIQTLTSVAATSQSQYLSLKNEFDSVQRMRELEKVRDKVGAIVSVAKKFTILLEHMRQFIAHLPPELATNDLVKGLEISYTTFVANELAQFGIKKIESLGLEPDAELHEVVMLDIITAEDIEVLNKLGYEGSDFVGRVIREFEVGYYYMDGEVRHIIKPSKVVVGQ